MNTQATFLDYLPLLLKGVPVTLGVTLLAMALAVPVSVILAIGRDSRFAAARWPAGFVIELFRGTSALVQLFWAFYVLPLFGINLSPLTAGVLVLGLNEGSYFSEVVRAALRNIPVGQHEASAALHLPRRYHFFRVILPQALPLMIPPFGNALVTMLKFTALVSLVTIQDLSFRANLIRNSLGSSDEVYSATLVIYFALALMLGTAVFYLERWANARAGHFTGPYQVSVSRIPRWATRGLS